MSHKQLIFINSCETPLIRFSNEKGPATALI